MMIKLGMPVGVSLLVAVAIGAAVGVFNGYLVAFVGIPSFIVTLGGLTLWRGLAFESTGGFDNAGMPDPLPFIGYGEVLGVPMPIVISGVYFVAMAFVLSSTKLGRYVHAMGSNEMGARQVGINIKAYKLAVYVVCGLSCALGAIVLMARMDSSSGKMAQMFELDAIAGDLFDRIGDLETLRRKLNNIGENLAELLGERARPAVLDFEEVDR
jgi:ribose/xylose/arabinose/galactoside ABC-type transport system permease subunit